MTAQSRAIAGAAAALALVLLLPVGASTGVLASHYLPQNGDFFDYSESVVLNNGVGNYTGYTEHANYTGSITVTGTLPNGTDSATYQSSGLWSNNVGQSQPWSESGAFTFSATTYHYVQGTDNQTGYVDPYVWFYLNNSAGVGATVYRLNTAMTVESDNASFAYPTSSTGYARAILTQGGGSYQRNDVYGDFTASYTWQEYFDPATGFILGYVYVETDQDGAGDGFTWTDTLTDSSTSFTVTPAAAPPSTSSSPNLAPLYVGIAIFVLLLIVIVVVAVAVSRRRPRGLGTQSLPRHSAQDVPAGSGLYAPPPPIDLIDRGQPTPQVVMRETVKVPCRFCGTLIDSTATVCPKCGAPRT